MSAVQGNAGGTEELTPGARKWVLIAGGLMAFGWLLLIASIAAGTLDGVLLAVLFIMLPVNFFWRLKLRSEWKKADPKGYKAAKWAWRKANWQRKLGIVAWGARGAVAQARDTVTDQSWRPKDLGDEPSAVTEMMWGGRREGAPRLGAPPLEAPSGAELAPALGKGPGAFFKAFFTPMRAAFAEWRATR